MCPDRISRIFGHSGPPSGQKRLGQPLVKLGQPWSNLVNPSQTWSNFSELREVYPEPSSWGYLMWRALVGSGRLGSGCLVLRADTRENPGGKNGVMTEWHDFITKKPFAGDEGSLLLIIFVHHDLIVTRKGIHTGQQPVSCCGIY